MVPSPRIVVLLGLVATQLACGGSCMFGPTCDPDTFVRDCNTSRSYQTCGYNEWTGDHHLSTIRCDDSEQCLLADGARPTCALEPTEVCTIAHARRCSGQGLHACDPAAARLDGQMLWRHERTCGEDEVCVQDGERAGCVASPPRTCDPAVRYRCEGGDPEACYGLVGPADAPEVAYWGPVLDPCADDETCQSDGSQVYCVVAPAEPCDSVGERRCVDGRRQVCQHGGGGVMGPPTPHWVWSALACP